MKLKQKRKSPARTTKKQFIERAIDIHGNQYNYSNIVFNRMREKVSIECKKHGEFLQTPTKHLLGRGCPVCAIESTGMANRKSIIEWINDFKEVHNDKYKYTEIFYENNNCYITAQCKLCRNIFKQKAIHHSKTGCGCPNCAESGFNPNDNAILYYLAVSHEDNIYYKIGITNRTVAERFKPSDLSKITVVKIIEYDNGKDAVKEEKRILKNYSKYKYIGKPILSSGNTELFIIDVLGWNDSGTLKIV
jgi:hypothetical protein